MASSKYPEKGTTDGHSWNDKDIHEIVVPDIDIDEELMQFITGKDKSQRFGFKLKDNQWQLEIKYALVRVPWHVSILESHLHSSHRRELYWGGWSYH